MPAELQITLLGSPGVALDGRPVTGFVSTKAQALVYYLAATGRSHTRDALAGLLWSDVPDATARKNLRDVLSNLRRLIDPYLLISRQSACLDPEAPVTVDCQRFSALLATAQRPGSSAAPPTLEDMAALSEAVELYQGDFLDGFYVPDASLFDDWLLIERQHLRQELEGALERLVDGHSARGKYKRAIGCAQRWLSLDPLREAAHRSLMRLYAWDGDRAAALRQYQECVQVLAEELGVEPAAETVRLYEQIRDGEFRGGAIERKERAIRGYELRERIGAGGFGVVYRAFQPSVGREVAVKAILPEFANHPDFIRRFESEAQLVARLEHLHIVPLYDYWREPDGAFLVMRWLRGGNLREALQHGPWKPEAAARLLDQTASALTVAHRQGVVHRDVKPENILLDEEGNGYLSDFGIAKDPLRATGATEPGAVVGSPSYISPEQAKGESITPQSDLYSLGVVMYQVLTGEHPFPGVTPAEQMVKHLTEPLPPLRERRPDLPEGLERVIERATAKDAGERYGDALSFATAFREAISDVAVEAVAPAPDLAPIDLVNPYKGLRAFEEADAADFFGREALTQQLLSRLTPTPSLPLRGGGSEEGGEARFLAVVGPSGSGKSSVVKAGLIPALRRGVLPGSDEWLITEMVPGAHPLEELEAALLRVAVNPPPSLIEQLQKDERGLLRAVKRTLPASGLDLLLVIDQFEELFTLVDDEAVRRHLMDSLLTAVTDPRCRLRVVITLRADFYDRPLQYVNFGQLLRAHMGTVIPLSNAELEQAICGPAEGAGATLEAGLVAAIIAEVNEQPGALPMLQYALTELFERRDGQLLTREAYRAIGGVTGALARRAEDVYEGLDEAGQAAARQLFLRLIALGEDVEDTRRRVLRAEIEALTPDDGQKVDAPLDVRPSPVISQVIDLYGRHRLLTFDRDPVTRAPTVEVAHEALLREWGRLRGWLDESHADVRMQRLLATAAGEWIEAQREQSFLLRGARLAQFDGWTEGSAVALTQTERDYLKASIELREREAAQREAQRQRELKQISIGLASQALLEIEGSSPERSVLLALEALENYPYTWQAEQALGQAVLGSNLRLILQHGTQVKKARWSPDGTRILTASDDGTARLWDATTGEELLTFYGVSIPQFSVLSNSHAWSPDGSRIVTGSGDGTVRLWDATTGEELLTFYGHASNTNINSVAWSPDGSRVVAASGDTAKVWDASASSPTYGEELVTLSGHGYGVTVATWSPTGKLIATGDHGGAVLVWDAVTGERLFDLIGHRSGDMINTVWWSPDGTRILTSSDDSTAKVWDTATGEGLVTLSGHTDYVQVAVWSPSGEQILTGSGDSTARVWDATTGEEVFTLAGHASYLWGGAWSPDGLHIVTWANDPRVRVWDGATGAEVLSCIAGFVYDVAWSPSGDRIVIAGADGAVRVWSLSPGLLTVRGPGGMPTCPAEWSPEGDRIARGFPDGTIKVWDASASSPTYGEELLAISGHPVEVVGIDWCPTGDRIVTSGEDGMLRVWDADTGERLLALAGHSGSVFALEWSPDGTRILSAGYEDHAVRIWDASTGTQLLLFTGHDDWIGGGQRRGLLMERPSQRLALTVPPRSGMQPPAR
jgi:WD40 repeat protein/serine/threonine protein kinase/DNA-binding SARP family transcriptional activator